MADYENVLHRNGSTGLRQKTAQWKKPKRNSHATSGIKDERVGPNEKLMLRKRDAEGGSATIPLTSVLRGTQAGLKLEG